MTRGLRTKKIEMEDVVRDKGGRRVLLCFSWQETSDSKSPRLIETRAGAETS